MNLGFIFRVSSTFTQHSLQLFASKKCPQISKSTLHSCLVSGGGAGSGWPQIDSRNVGGLWPWAADPLCLGLGLRALAFRFSRRPLVCGPARGPGQNGHGVRFDRAQGPDPSGPVAPVKTDVVSDLTGPGPGPLGAHGPGQNGHCVRFDRAQGPGPGKRLIGGAGQGKELVKEWG